MSFSHFIVHFTTVEDSFIKICTWQKVGCFDFSKWGSLP